MIFSIEFRPSVLKNISHLPKRDLVRIKKKIEQLSANLPNPTTTKMQGNNSFHRIRAGDYRIIYEIKENILTILIVKIAHRKDAYRNLS